MRILSTEEDSKLMKGTCPGCEVVWANHPDTYKVCQVSKMGAVLRCTCGKAYLRAPLVLLSEYDPQLRSNIENLVSKDGTVTTGCELEDCDFH